MLPIHFHMIALPSSDLEKTLQFYRGIGFEPKQIDQTLEGNKHILQFHGPYTILSFYHLSLQSKIFGEVKISPQEESGQLLCINMEHETEVDDFYKRLEAADPAPRFLKPPEFTAWGSYACFFADPDYNKFEINFNPNRIPNMDNLIR